MDRSRTFVAGLAASLGVDPAELDGLSNASLRALAHGVRGGDGDDTTPTEPTAPAEGDTAPAENDQPAGDGAGEGEGEGDQAPEASTDAIVVPELPAEITAADEADLRALFGELETLRAEQLPLVTTAEGVAVIESIVERQTAIAAELQRRLDDAAAVQQSVQALAEAEPIALPGPAPVLASAAAVVAARGVQPPAAQNPPAPVARTRPRAAIQAGMGTDVLSDEGVSLERLGTMVERASTGGNGKVYLASLPAFEIGWQDAGLPEPLSRRNSTEHNDALIAEAQEDFAAARRGEAPARMAAAGGAHQGAICEPVEILRDIPEAFSAREVVGPEFPNRPMGRGGFTYTTSYNLSELTEGAAIWDEDDQSTVDVDDPDTWKPIVDLDCPTPATVKVEFATAALRFDNTLEMSNPERIRNAMNALMAIKARNKEARLLQRIDTLSHRYTFGLEYGAVPTLIRAINTVLAQGTYANRLEDGGYTVFLPPGVTAILLNDRAAKGYNNQERDDLLAYIRDNTYGVNRVVQTMDASAGGEGGVPFSALNAVGNAATELPKLGNVYRIRLVDPAGAIYAETGEVNTGVERDPNLRRMNKAQLFAEEGFVLTKNGPQPWFSMDVELCDNGDRAGLTEPFTCPAAS